MNNEYRFYQLTYCNVCKLRDLNIEKGIICSLTNNIAKFEKECSDYDFDDLELAKIKNEIAQKIEHNYFEKKSSVLISGHSYFTRKKDIKTKTSFSKKENIHNKIFKEVDYKWSIIAFFGSICFISILFSFFNSKSFYITLGSLLMGSIVYYYETIKIKKVIIIKKDYFQFGDNKIYWREILDYGICTIPNDDNRTEEILLFTMNRGIIKIKTYNYNYLSNTKMIEILNYNKSDLAD